ncbi:EamA family transporter RarD [Woodsholea maritima]|uniref:EamA family transporter RarD n=1 Tax=Woodsholea maritima TaxID=240237 RepID=UPI000369FCCB|nr:EamA family transporter RarD [Woodsholea maritima]
MREHDLPHDPLQPGETPLDSGAQHSVGEAKTVPAPDISAAIRDRMDPLKAGLIAFTAYVIWGLSTIFYKFLAFADPSEIVLHRAVWSVPTLAVILLAASKWKEALGVLADRRALLILAATSVLIAANWWTFIFAINAGKILSVSLGYFINPLMNVAVGVFIAHERFGKMRLLAVSLAGLGVINQVIAVGQIPVIGLFLAASFTLYGYIRKTIKMDGRVGQFWETVIIAIPSILYLGYEFSQGHGHFFEGPRQAILLMLAGPMTVAPLLLFIIGARGVSFATLGVLQFVAPTLQFITGLAYGEAFSWSYAITFALIWLGLGVFVWDLVLYARKMKRSSSADKV